jgi:hypothetical protein
MSTIRRNPLPGSAKHTQPVAFTIDSIDRMVLVYGLPLDSFTFDVIFCPKRSPMHVLEWCFKLMQTPSVRMN